MLLCYFRYARFSNFDVAFVNLNLRSNSKALQCPKILGYAKFQMVALYIIRNIQKKLAVFASEKVTSINIFQNTRKVLLIHKKISDTITNR